MLVLAIDTSTPTMVVGVVRVKQPHELLAEAARQARATSPAGNSGDGDGDGARRGAGDGADSAGSGAGRSDGRGGAGGGAAGFLSGTPIAVLAERTLTDPFGHAENLMPLTRAALADAGHSIRELGAVVVGVGPGPYTGLRVGMVTAAALGDALDIPAHGVPSHDAQALRAAWVGDFLVVTDARRREVYLSAYAESGARLHGPVVTAHAAIPEVLAAQRLSPEWMTGAGAQLAADALGLPVRDVPAPLSEFLVQCAARALLTGAVPGPLVPLYLRRPDAAEPSAPKPVLPPPPAAGSWS